MAIQFGYFRKNTYLWTFSLLNELKLVHVFLKLCCFSFAIEAKSTKPLN